MSRRRERTRTPVSYQPVPPARLRAGDFVIWTGYISGEPDIFKVADAPMVFPSTRTVFVNLVAVDGSDDGRQISARPFLMKERVTRIRMSA